MIFRKMFQEPSRQNETGREREREKEHPGRGIISDAEPHGPTYSSPHTPDWGPLAAETRTEPGPPAGSQTQGKGVREGQEAASLWRMEGSFLGDRGYPGRKACVNKRALARHA